MAVRWHFSREALNSSPSRRDGVSEGEEKQYRRKTCLFIEAAAARLRLPKITVATAHVFFHRFFCRQSFKQHDRFLIAATCLFLAAKVEETPKKLHDVLQVTHQLRRKARDPLDTKGEEYVKLREKLLICERILLHTIAFDLCIEHPYKYLLDMVKILKTKYLRQLDKKRSQEIAQAAWNFVNDSMQTDLCLQYPAGPIAAAAVYMSCLFNKEVPQAKDGERIRWWRSLNINESALNAICSQILDLYESNPDPRFLHLRKEYSVSEKGSTSTVSSLFRPSPPHQPESHHVQATTAGVQGPEGGNSFVSSGPLAKKARVNE